MQVISTLTRLTALSTLAAVYRHEGKYAQAERMLTQAVETPASSAGPGTLVNPKRDAKPGRPVPGRGKVQRIREAGGESPGGGDTLVGGAPSDVAYHGGISSRTYRSEHKYDKPRCSTPNF